MNIYALSDLHLSFSADKPMNIFGQQWDNYEEKMRNNWNKIVKDDDFVLICGDISWATYIEDSLLDFRFIESLKGTKIISKGNHDYWWTTASKQKEFLDKNNIDKIMFLHNNSYVLPIPCHSASSLHHPVLDTESPSHGIAVCGARGWLPEEMHKNDQDKKIYDRELIRLELSLKSVPQYCEKIIAMLHYPPDNKVMQILSNYKVSECVYGHLHAHSHKYAIYGTLDGVRYNLTSCDYLGFAPLKIV